MLISQVRPLGWLLAATLVAACGSASTSNHDGGDNQDGGGGGDGGGDGGGGTPDATPAELFVNAGPDQVLALPANETTFTAIAGDGPNPVATIAWTQVDGPTAALAGTTQATLTVSNLTEGTYTFRVIVTGTGDTTASDDVQLVVTANATLCDGPTFHVAPGGNDNGDGSAGQPWATLAHATQTATTAGATIRLAAGTYVETQTSQLAAGVCLVGAGADQTTVRSTIDALFTPIVSLNSPEGTDGNQHIADITFDGDDLRTRWGIAITGRSNVALHNLVMRDFADSCVWWGGRNDSENAPPTIYATGNSFYANVTENCAGYDGYGRGQLTIGGQEGMRIYDNTMTQDQRPAGQNGWLIKAQVNDGHLRGVKIYDNTIVKAPYDGITWDFALELFNVAGVEIYGNQIEGGGIDTNMQHRDGYPYSVYIHDNEIFQTQLRERMENAITLEFDTHGAIVENNLIRNVGVCVFFTPRPESTIEDVRIVGNVCDAIGVADGSSQGFAVRFGDNPGYTIDDLFIYNNVFWASASEAPFWGIGLPVNPTREVYIHNNVIRGFSYGYISINGGVEGLTVSHNLLIGNGNDNEPRTEGAPQNVLIESNLIDLNPMFVGEHDFHLMPGSPCIDSGLEVSERAFSGAGPDIGAFEYE